MLINNLVSMPDALENETRMLNIVYNPTKDCSESLQGFKRITCLSGRLGLDILWISGLVKEFAMLWIAINHCNSTASPLLPFNTYML